MNKKNIFWNHNEPRVFLPFFADQENYVDITIQESFSIFSKKLIAPLYYLIKKRKNFYSTMNDYFILIFKPAYKFRGIFFSNDGQMYKSEEFEGKFRTGDIFHLNLNKWIGNNTHDGIFILIANHGRADFFNSSPGNVSINYLNKNYLSGFRTGFFCRKINEEKKHFGFTGINPQIQISDNKISSLLLINHSSKVNYKEIVKPIVRLYKNKNDYLEACFGEIKPYCGLERSIKDLFPDAKIFLKKSEDQAFTITSLQGSSLASIHIIRNNFGQLLAIDHSRPAYPNILNYL